MIDPQLADEFADRHTVSLLERGRKMNGMDADLLSQMHQYQFFREMFGDQVSRIDKPPWGRPNAD